MNQFNMDSLPKQFVSAMRTLFDIMDDKKTGYVNLGDIENRWRDDRTKGLPSGLIESLQKVASHDGLLTFDRFCTGLKICLLRNQVDTASNKVECCNDHDVKSDIHVQVNETLNIRPPSAPLLNLNSSQPDRKSWNSFKPSKSSSQQRTISMPQLMGDSILHDLRHQQSVTIKTQEANHRVFVGPPKPPRLEKVANEIIEISRSSNSYKKEDKVVFKNAEAVDIKLEYESMARAMEEQSRGLGDGRSASDGQTETMRRTSRRREPRRHTLHNGVDYNLLKRMKQIEQEKDVLLQGLSSVEEAREWYLKRLSEVQERMRYAGRMGVYVEPWSEAHQERLELLRARVLELNRQLGALTTGWRHGSLSLHMNLALPVTPISTSEPNHATMLRSQNRVLVEEVTRKNEKISLLEREKSSLIRELLVQRNRVKMLDNFN